jgi:hypothetical protein
VALTKCKGLSLRSAWQTGRWPPGGKLEHTREDNPKTFVCPYRCNDVEGVSAARLLLIPRPEAGLCVSQSLAAARQFTALHQLGPNNVPADAEQPGGLNLVAVTEVIGCSRDCCLDLRV